MTVDRAQALCEEFCEAHFHGHQALVCTHPNGHNHSGNIHVHIVINSLRIEEVPLLPGLERPAGTTMPPLSVCGRDVTGKAQERKESPIIPARKARAFDRIETAFGITLQFCKQKMDWSLPEFMI